MTTLPSHLSGEELKKFELPRLSAEDLEKLTSHKLAAIAAKLITMKLPQGPDPAEPVESLLAELDHTAPTGYVKTSIRKAIAARQTLVDQDALNAAMRMDSVVNKPSGEVVDDHVSADEPSVLVTFAQSSATAMASFKHPRDAPPLRMVETEASKQRKTYAEATASSASSQRQYALSTLAVATALVAQPQRPPDKREVISTEHLGAFEGHPTMTVRMGSTRKTVPKAAIDSRKKGASVLPAPNAGVQSSAAGTTGVSLTNHFDRFVATRQQTVAGVTASAGKDASSLPAVTVSQQSAVATLSAMPASQQVAVATLSAVPPSQQSAIATEQSAIATLSVVPVSQSKGVEMIESAGASLSKSQDLPPKESARFIPDSLFLSVSDDDDSYENNQLPYVPDEGSKTPSPLPPPIMDASSEDNISDNPSEDDSVIGETTGDNRQHSDEGQDDVNTQPQDPNDPLHLTLGPASLVPNDLSGHLSESLESCFSIEVGARATYLPPGFTYGGVREGPYVTCDLHSKQLVHETPGLQVHGDDAQMLSAVQLDDLRFFSARSEFIFQVWDTFHACTNISDVKKVLELMSGDDHVFLLVLHAAYANYDIDFSLSFGQAKAAFYSFAQQCRFEHGSFDTFPDNTPVSSVRPEFFLVRTIPQVLAYLAWHAVSLSDLPMNMSNDQIIRLAAIRTRAI